jgi:hypothetical protein
MAQNCKILPVAKVVQDTGEVFSHEKQKHKALQNMTFLHFFLFGGSFLPSWIRIRIQPTKNNADSFDQNSTTH